MKKIFIIEIILIFLSLFRCEYGNDQFITPIPDMKSRIKAGKVIYLSKNGSDSYPGTQQQPVASFQRALELAGDYADIYIATGTYEAYNADIKISLYGGYSADFQMRDSSFISEIVGTGFWGNPFLPTLKIIGRKNIVIDGLTVRASKNATFKPVAILISNCDSTVLIQNCRIFGQIRGEALGTSALVIVEASPNITNNSIYGGEMLHDGDAVNGIRCEWASPKIKNNYIYGGKSVGCVQGIFSIFSKAIIEGNTIIGGESISDDGCYACAIRTGNSVEHWDASGSSDIIKGNIIIGGGGYRTYGIIASQESDLRIIENSIIGGQANIVSIGIYIKTNDKPHIIGNIFSQCRYATYEWAIGDYMPGATSDAYCIHNNTYEQSTIHVLAHWYDELEDKENDVIDINGVVQTSEGIRPLSWWGNKLK